ncbi:MAG TPA: class I SAM-dependent methyltransferase [Ideonella sp.]|uniref:class I SAM-dependent methyltransferase n=1 Tax=Ideonella sp. TaxID=1929293 RepID=UPI002C56FFFC|nr:class I SAM-dependent methyltransferase [Ideonella sp.]HSI47688.1 class I SAM-dependent methyltransferase [Ideonella sp.]
MAELSPRAANDPRADERLPGFEVLGLKRPQFADLALWTLLSDYDFGSVLDVGGGAGEHSEVFLAFGKQVTTVDYGKSVYFERRSPQLQCVIGDFNTLELPERYDCVWCSHVLEHQLDAQRFLGRLHGALREGGVLALSVPPMKHQIVGGHVSLWNAGLLLYRLVLAGFDCRQARVRQYGYNISVLLEKRSIEVPELAFDCGDIRRLKAFLPANLPFASNALDDPFDGNLQRLNW